MPRGSKPGERRGGRKAGTPNKMTQDQRQILQSAFHDVGGVRRFVEWGNENLTEFYKLWGRAIPHQVQGDPDNPIGLVIRVVKE